MGLNKEINPKQRKIIGAIIMVIAVVVGIWQSYILGAVILLIGLWVFNPGKKKENQENT